MMDMINGFDNATAIMGGGSQQLPAGVYVGKVVNVKLGKSQKGDEMLTLAMDIAEGDHKDFYRKQFDRKAQYKKEGEDLAHEALFDSERTSWSVWHVMHGQTKEVTVDSVTVK